MVLAARFPAPAGSPLHEERVLEDHAALAYAGPGVAALDVDGTRGRLASALAGTGAQVTMLLDPRTAAHRTADVHGARRPAVVEGDACAMPFDDGAFDALTCHTAASRLADLHAFLGEAARVLSPGGRMVLHDVVLPEHTASAVFVDTFERLRDRMHVGSLPASAWVAAAEAAGLAVESHEVTAQRIDFSEWHAAAECAPETVDALATYVRRMPRRAAEWLDPRWADDDPEAAGTDRRTELESILSRRITLVARKEN